MIRCLLAFCICVYLSNFAMAQVDSHVLQDSFISVIAKETNDSSKVGHISRYISRTPTKDDKEILKLFDQGRRLCRNLSTEELLYDLYMVTSSKLSYIGYKEQSRIKCEEMIKLLTNQPNKNVKYFSKVQLELARYDNEEGNLQSAEDRIKSIVDLHRDIEPTLELVLAYNEKAISLRNKGELDVAIMYSDSAIAVCDVLDDISEKANVYSGRGRIYRALGLNDEAREDYLVAMNIAKENNISKSLSVILNNLGNIEHISGNYNDAIAYYMQSLEIKEKRNDVRGISIACHNIGAIKFDMEDWTGALADFDKSNELANSIKFKTLVVHNNLKIGNVHYEKSDYKTALQFHTAALDLSRKLDFKYGEIAGLYNVGRDNLQQGGMQNASIILLEALSLAEKHGNRPLEAAILISLSDLYMQSEIDNNISGVESLLDVDIEQLLLRAKAMSDEMNNAENKLDVMSSLHNFYLANYNYRKDADILNEYVMLKDSLFNQQMAESMADWQTKYQTAEQQKEIIELESANKIESLKSRQFKGLLFGSIAFFSLLFFFGYNFLRQNTRKKQAKQRELFRSKLSSDLHDDVGSILTGLAMQSELLSNFADDNIKGSMENLAHMSRDAMTRMRDTVWAIDSRKDSFPDLIDRMLDFGKDILLPADIQLVMDSDKEKNNRKIEPVLRQNLYLIFKEAVTNVAKYSSGNKVEVKISQEKNIVNMIIQDNGIVDPTQVRTSGTGTSNMIKRAEDLSGEAKISYDHNGYKIEVAIPLR